MTKSQLVDTILLSLMWGPAFMFMKFALPYFPPLTLTALRVIIGAAILFVILITKKLSFPKSDVLKHLLFISIFSCVIPYSLFAFAAVYVESIVQALLTGILPALTCIIAHKFLENEKINLIKVLGIFIGFVGYSTIFLPTILDGKFDLDSVGILICLLASMSHAIGMVYTRRHLQGVNNDVATTTNLVLSCLILIPITLIIDKPWNLQAPDLKSVIGIIFLGVFGTAGAYMLYFKIAKKYGATALSLVAYLIPVVGTITGTIFLNERPTIYFALGVLFIMLSLYLVNKKSTKVLIKNN